MQRGRRPRPAKSNANGVLAVVGVGVIGAGLLVFALAGNRGSPDTVPEALPAPREPARIDPKDAAREQAFAWYRESFLDELERPKKLGGNKIHALFSEAKTKGYPEALGERWRKYQKRVYESLLRREPDDPDANRFFGRTPLSDYPGFFDLFLALTDERTLPKDLAALRDRYEGQARYAPHWRAPAVDPKEFERVARLLRRYQELRKKLEDPNERAIHEALARVKLDPILGRYETVHVRRPPWVLFYAHHELTPKDDSEAERRRIEKKRAELKQRLDGYTTLLSDYLAYFKKRWMQPLGLKDFKPGKLFYVWMFDDRKSFDEYGRSIRQVHPPGLMGYFSNKNHWVYLYEPAKNRAAVASTLAHELTHQLQWHFSAGSGPFENHFIRSKGAWFKEGWAEYVGWCERGKDQHYSFERPATDRMRVFETCRKLNLPILPIRRLVQAESYPHYAELVGFDPFRSRLTLLKNGWLAGELRRRKLKINEGMAGTVLAVYFEMLYSESWLLVRFGHEYQNGRYRKAMMKFTKASLRGYLGYVGNRGYAQAHEVFAEEFGLKTSNDWDRLQREFDRYLDETLRQTPPKR